jgi:hypothetical protein
MLVLISEAGRSFLRAFGAALIVLIPGILAAPNLTVALSLSGAALIAAITMGIKAVQVFVPALSFKSLIPARFVGYGNYVDSFARAAIAAFIVGVLGWLALPNLDFSRSVIFGIITGALAAGIRAIQGALTPGDVPTPQSGLTLPAPNQGRK